MSPDAYAVALLTRGAGGYTYTYAGPPGLARGQLSAVSFRGKLELGVVTAEAEDTGEAALLPLVPLAVAEYPRWGHMLCDVAELCAATPREVAGRLLFDAPARGLQLYLDLNDPAALPAKLRSGLAALAGRLTPKRRQQLLALSDWAGLAAEAAAGTIAIRLEIAGAAESSRPHSKLARSYEVERHSAGLLGLPRETPLRLPGSYLAGLEEDLDFPWPAAGRGGPAAEELSAPAKPGALSWEAAELPADWELCRRWPGLAELAVRRVAADWPKLRDESGLIADLLSAALAGQRVLLLSPLGWILERLWPALGPWAGRVHRYCVDAGPSAAAVVLKALKEAGQIVCGLEGAWKLAAYGDFDRVVVLDPSHPQYEPEGEPWLDARLALLVALAGRKCRLDLVELGMSLFDGRTRLKRVELQPPHEPESSPAAQGSVVDINPLPLKLRQPDRRRLVYFNRLGQSRGLRCMECATAVRCPRCSSSRLYYSAAAHGYRCSACGLEEADLRCRVCGTAQLAAEYPGLEAIDRRRGDALVAGGRAGRLAHAEHQSVVGTMQLLEPVSEFWPQELVYIHPDARGGALDSWPKAIDMAARLAALYANPQLEQVYIISGRLVEQLGAKLTADQIREEYAQELTLRRLAGLPPFGQLCRFRLRGPDGRALVTAGGEVLEWARAADGATVSWLGRRYVHRGAPQLAGYFSAPADFEPEPLQRLRAGLSRRRIKMSVKAEWMPWL